MNILTLKYRYGNIPHIDNVILNRSTNIDSKYRMNGNELDYIAGDIYNTIIWINDTYSIENKLRGRRPDIIYIEDYLLHFENSKILLDLILPLGAPIIII